MWKEFYNLVFGVDVLQIFLQLFYLLISVVEVWERQKTLYLLRSCSLSGAQLKFARSNRVQTLCFCQPVVNRSVAGLTPPCREALLGQRLNFKIELKDLSLQFRGSPEKVCFTRSFTEVIWRTCGHHRVHCKPAVARRNSAMGLTTCTSWYQTLLTCCRYSIWSFWSSVTSNKFVIYEGLCQCLLETSATQPSLIASCKLLANLCPSHPALCQVE